MQFVFINAHGLYSNGNDFQCHLDEILVLFNAKFFIKSLRCKIANGYDRTVSYGTSSPTEIF